MYDHNESAEQELAFDPNELAKRQRLINGVGILIGLALIGVGGAELAWGWDVIRDQQRGPVTLKAGDLAAAQKLSALPANWVTFKPTSVRDIGVRRDLVANNGARYTTYKYSLAKLDDRQLIVESHAGVKVGSPLTGHLEQWSKDNDILAEIRAKDPEARDADLLPFQLETHSDQGTNFVWLLVFIGGFSLFGLAMVVAGLVGLRKRSQPTPEAPPELVFRAAPSPGRRPQR